MSTAHRPTFHPAVGSATPGGYRYNAPRQGVHSKDQHAQLTLKYRHTQPSTTSADEAKQQLEEREAKARADRKRVRANGADEEDEEDSRSSRSEKRAQLLLTSGEEKVAESAATELDPPVRLDLSSVDLSQFDDADAVLSDREQDDSDDDAGDSSDDEAELQRELEKIKREREAERKRKADDEAAAQAATTALLHSNPLLAGGGAAFTTKRRWDDDVVFKNQSRGDVTEKVPKRFINDSIRNDFHKSFMKRYVR